MKLAHLQSQLMEVDSLIAQLEESSVSDPRPSVFANIRAFRRSTESYKANSNKPHLAQSMLFTNTGFWSLGAQLLPVLRTH
jgi:hypothetical protein